MTTKAADTAETGSQFDGLLADIAASDTLLKSTQASDDAAIAAAAEEGGEDTEEGAEGADTVAGGEGKDELTKSLKVIGDDGEISEGFDATDLLKSLITQVAGLTKVVEQLAPLVTGNVTLTKSLQVDFAKAGLQGRGRRAVVTMHEKLVGGDLTKSLAATEAARANEGALDKVKFLAKALELVESGKLGSRDVNHAETLINRGQQPQEHVREAVYAALGA